MSPSGTSLDAEALLAELAQFCKRAGDKCYAAWPMERIRQYLAFHARHNTLVFFRAPSGAATGPEALGVSAFRTFETPTRVAGTAVAWQCEERRLRARLAQSGNGFEWKATDAAGDCVFVADVVSARPGGMGVLIGTLVRRFPHWRQLKILTMRKGRLVEYPQRIVEKIVREKGH